MEFFTLLYVSRCYGQEIPHCVRDDKKATLLSQATRLVILNAACRHHDRFVSSY
jgi:hypothetical protein